MELKKYQLQVIKDLDRFLELLIEKQNISKAYNALWNEKGINVGIDGMPPYNPELAGVPQVCFKVPTGGGKTFLAANSLKPKFSDAKDTVSLYCIRVHEGRLAQFNVRMNIMSDNK